MVRSTWTRPPPRSMNSISDGEIMGCSVTLKTNFRQANARRKPAAPMNQKQLCQPYLWVSHPKRGAKATSAKYCEALKMAEARPRSAVGNHVATIRPLPGKTGDCARPERRRRTKIALNIHAEAR